MKKIIFILLFFSNNVFALDLCKSYEEIDMNKCNNENTVGGRIFCLEQTEKKIDGCIRKINSERDLAFNRIKDDIDGKAKEIIEPLIGELSDKRKILKEISGLFDKYIADLSVLIEKYNHLIKSFNSQKKGVSQTVKKISNLIGQANTKNRKELIAILINIENEEYNLNQKNFTMIENASYLKSEIEKLERELVDKSVNLKFSMNTRNFDILLGIIKKPMNSIDYMISWSTETKRELNEKVGHTKIVIENRVKNLQENEYTRKVKATIEPFMQLQSSADFLSEVNDLIEKIETIVPSSCYHDIPLFEKRLDNINNFLQFERICIDNKSIADWMESGCRRYMTFYDGIKKSKTSYIPQYMRLSLNILKEQSVDPDKIAIINELISLNDIDTAAEVIDDLVASLGCK